MQKLLHLTSFTCFFRAFAVFIAINIQTERNCHAQSSPNIFEHLTTEHGLSSDKVEAILQDREGFYWISTQNGLNRYDGTSFKVFRNDPSDSTSLTHNNCRNLLEGLNGDIWVATYKGISRYIKSKGLFQPIYLHHPVQNFEIANRISKMAMDEHGNIWIAGFGLWKYDIFKDSISLYSHDATNVHSISNAGFINQFVPDKVNNGIWMTTSGELNFFSFSERMFFHKHHNPKGWSIFEIPDIDQLAIDHKNRLWVLNPVIKELSYFDLEKNIVRSSGKKIKTGLREIFADEKGRIWICFWSAPSEIFDPATSITNKEFFIPRHRHSVGNQTATFLYIDQQLNYWIASRSGISIYNDRRQYYNLHHIGLAEKDTSEKPLAITAIAQIDSQGLWLGTNFGLHNYSFASENYREVSTGDIRVPVHALLSDDNVLWVGLKDRIVCLDAKSEKILKTLLLKPGIIFIKKGSYNDLWVGLWTGGLFRIDLSTEEIFHYVKESAKINTIKSNSLISGLTDNENFWIGHNRGNGFSKYNVPSDSFTHFHPKQDDQINSNDGTINVIAKDQKGRMWIGTHGSGVLQFDPIAVTYEHFHQQHGLKSNYINSIIPDKNDNLWISTADGINFFNPQTRTIIPLDIDLKFIDNDFAANGIYGLNGNIYFFRRNEFVEINPERYKPESMFPKIVISSFKVFNREVPVSGKPELIELTHKENFFSFDFSSVKINPLQHVLYAYYLEGFDKEWNTVENLPTASYTNVPGGNYNFQVKAKNETGQWSDILLDVAIHIQPPFWRTWWFVLLCVCSVSGVVYSIYWYRVRQLKRIHSIKSKISQDLHDEVGSTLSSINVYSSIASNSLDKNNALTEKALHHINRNSRLVMESMSDIVWAINSGNPGISTLEDKLKNYGYELLTPLNINTTYVVASDAEKKLSHMEARKNILLVAKEAMNNIGKYSGATEAIVKVEINHRILSLSISDNGKGFNMASKRSGNGIHNMRRRTEALGGQFEITSQENIGTSIICTIPVTNISNT